LRLVTVLESPIPQWIGLSPASRATLQQSVHSPFSFSGNVSP
jgi:hypothetical protein